ncbi:hypothetical protein G7047_04915 [Diaphorobacter sp. HDW4A]|uniref:hypothetical protein n=1 Tax=Diaphorobacter sp. HDW4A TaxID=2714924 RepID=UPI00140A000E|nr:hypothetical protein [Diaphorobacter sp. HDW4A]QIL79319.1 hypothetical protein G7047_04915 [Diaphorobacter sp. HDW4A]
MPGSNKEGPQPQTAAQRQHKYQKSLAEKGLERITLTVDRASVQRMRDISRDHNATFGEVFKLGLLVAERELAKRAAETP